ncbi:hypothetical protein NA56DRAFT_708545 [Hyaloscypha hepaticicola]|uniref:Uncharacterized protein n=1 Tax=Hyaloscypha hepaticicola TaxID=2082293 RepID=A0A2J6PRJ3_9HELO|nr:hypothetical protein NA56DRAFT_708545 [Hyaloscypha hepaticicola]
MPYFTPSIVKSPDEVFPAIADSVDPYQYRRSRKELFMRHHLQIRDNWQFKSIQMRTSLKLTIVEDENGNVARLVIGFQDDSLSTSGPILSINSTRAIKVPYCKFTSEASIWLTEQYRFLRNPSKTLKYAFEVLRNFGFVNAVRQGNLKLDFKKGIANSESFNMLRYAAEVYLAVGKVELSGRCVEEARRMFTILTGCDVGNEEVFAG